MNKDQIVSLIRYLVFALGAVLVKRDVISSTQAATWSNYVIDFLMTVGPVLWSLWSKTHAQQAAKAIEIVNSVEGIVGDASKGQVSLLPDASPKPPSKGIITPVALLLMCLVPATALHTGCQGTTALVVTTQTVKAVGEGAEATIAASAQMYQAGQITAAQARSILDFYNLKFQPAFRTAASGVEVGVAPAPSNLVQLATDLANLLASYKKP